MSQDDGRHRRQALFGDAPPGGGGSPRGTPAAKAAAALPAHLQPGSPAAGSPLVPGSAKKLSGAAGLLAHRHAMAAAAAAAVGGANHSPHVQAAFKEIVASPSPKVSALVERFKHKEALHVEAAVVEREREQKRAAMLAEAQKVRAARKRAAEDSEAKFKRAEQLRAEADSALAKQRERSAAARHTYNELAAKRGVGGNSAALGASETEDEALADAERIHKQRIKEAELAKAAMTAARAEHDKAIRMEQAFLTIHTGSDDGGPEQQEMEDGAASFASPLSGLQVLSPPASSGTLVPSSPCEVAAEEERLAWWAKEEYETVMEEERRKEDAERREKMRRLEAEEAERREEERKQREERERQEKEAKQRAIEREMEARRNLERQEMERKERERAEAEERERKRLEELEERERRERMRREQERLERERQEREQRDRKMAEVKAHGSAAVAAVLEAVREHNLGAAHQALQSLKTLLLAESLFVTDELRGEEQQVNDAVHALEKEHARAYNERLTLIELGQAHLDAAHTAMKDEDLGVARELVCASLEALADAAAPCDFADIGERLKPRIDGDVAQAQETQQEILVRASCAERAEQLLQDCRSQLAAGDCAQARVLVQEARTTLRRAHVSSRDADLKLVCEEIDAAERLQMERNAEEQQKRELLDEGEVQMAAALALVTKAASEAEMTHARALLQQAKDCFERAGAPPQLFEELTSMLQQVVEAETLLRRKAEIEQQVFPPAARARALPVAVCTLSRACARLDAYQEGVHQYGIGCRL